MNIKDASLRLGITRQRINQMMFGLDVIRNGKKYSYDPILIFNVDYSYIPKTGYDITESGIEKLRNELRSSNY